jgi:hypothetical protein
MGAARVAFVDGLWLARGGADDIDPGSAQRQESTRRMTIRIRKLIGTVALFVLVTVWALLAMTLAQSALTDVNYWVAALFYLVAGMGWILPAMPLIRWMYGKGAKGPKSEAGQAVPGH